MKTPRFALFRICGTKEIAVHDENEMPVTFATEREALLESLEEVEEHIRQFKAGERAYEEIVFQPEEFVEVVEVGEDGVVYDACGASFGKRT